MSHLQTIRDQKASERETRALRRLRNYHGLTIWDVAKAAGVSFSHVQYTETGLREAMRSEVRHLRETILKLVAEREKALPQSR